MNILVVSQYYYPEQFRINDICEELVSRGHDVTVLTGLPNYPEGEIFAGYKKNYLKVDIHNGVRIIRCKTIPRHKGGIALLINYISYAIKASRRILKLKENFDVVYVYQLSPVTTIYPAIKYKKKKKIPIYVYCCDIWPESVRETSDGSILKTTHPLYISAKYLSKKLYTKSDMIGVKCTYFSDYLNETCGVEIDKIKLLYEHAEESYLSVSEKPSNNGCYDFMFLGNIGASQNCDYLVKAIKKIHTNKPFKLHFVGNGSSLESLKKYVIDNKLDEKVVFHGRHPVSEINSFYSFADCCMLSLSEKTAIGLTPPAKLVGYMAASRPIIAAAGGATKDIINEAKCGICVKSKDIDALASAMEYAIEHSYEFEKMGINGRCYFKNHFTIKKHIDELERQLIKLLDS